MSQDLVELSEEGEAGSLTEQLLAKVSWTWAWAQQAPPDEHMRRLLDAVAAGEPLTNCSRTAPLSARRKKRSWARPPERLPSLGVIDGSHCDGPVDEPCYLISDEFLHGSYRSLDCFGVPADAPERNLPSWDVWGFVDPDCWRYVHVRYRKLARPDDELRARANEAAQEWRHPASGLAERAPLRVAVRGRCMPLLLGGGLAELSHGVLRRDTVATTITTRGRSGAIEHERRATVVERVVVDAAASGALSRARASCDGCVNPVVLLPSEAGGLSAAAMSGAGARRIERGSSAMLAANSALLLANALVIVYGVQLWRLFTRVRVVEWIQKIRPHMGATVGAARVVSWGTLPVRALVGGATNAVRRRFAEPEPPPKVTASDRLAEQLRKTLRSTRTV